MSSLLLLLVLVSVCVFYSFVCMFLDFSRASAKYCKWYKMQIAGRALDVVRKFRVDIVFYGRERERERFPCAFHLLYIYNICE